MGLMAFISPDEQALADGPVINFGTLYRVRRYYGNVENVEPFYMNGLDITAAVNANFDYDTFIEKFREHDLVEWACDYLGHFGLIAVPCDAGDCEGILGVPSYYAMKEFGRSGYRRKMLRVLENEASDIRSYADGDVSIVSIWDVPGTDFDPTWPQGSVEWGYYDGPGELIDCVGGVAGDHDYTVKEACDMLLSEHGRMTGSRCIRRRRRWGDSPAPSARAPTSTGRGSTSPSSPAIASRRSSSCGAGAAARTPHSRRPTARSTASTST